MAEIVISATNRTDRGKNAARRLRRRGLVPGIVYGGKGENLSCGRPEGSAKGAPFRSRTERDFEALYCRSWLHECNSKELASGSGQRELLTCGFLPDRDGCCDPRDSAHPRCRGSTRRESRCWNPRIGHPGNRSRMLTGRYSGTD